MDKAEIPIVFRDNIFQPPIQLRGQKFESRLHFFEIKLPVKQNVPSGEVEKKRRSESVTFNDAQKAEPKILIK